MNLLVQNYLRSGKTLENLKKEHGIKYHVYNGKVSLTYDQIDAKESDPLAQQCRGLILRQDSWDIVACPMFRFFNYGQEVCAPIDWGSAVFEEKLDGCFLKNAKLNCWDGTCVKIGDVVDNKLSPTLIGMDENGKLVPTKVVNWFNNGTKSNWLEVTVDTLIRKDSGAGGHPNKIRVTSNHHLYLNEKFQSSDNAKIGDDLISYEKSLSESAIHYIKSSLLGDGSLIWNKTSSVQFQEGHCLEQEQLTFYTAFNIGYNNGKILKYKSGYGSDMLRFTSIYLKSLIPLRNEWYKENKKIVPEDLTWMDDFTIAKWYMDDGSLSHSDSQKDRASFSTHGFTKSDVQRLAEKLEKMYGISCTVENSKGWYIRVNAGRKNEIDTFWKAIAPYIISNMRYKLPSYYRNYEFKISEPGNIFLNKIKCKILNIKNLLVNKKNFPSGARGFDIGTTTTNYMINGVLVHNSLISVYHDTVAQRWYTATRSLPEANAKISGLDIDFTTLVDFTLQQQKNIANLNEFMNQFPESLRLKTFCFELCTPLNRIVCCYPEYTLTLLFVRDLITLQEEDPKIYASILGLPSIKTYDVSDVTKMIKMVFTWNPKFQEGVVVKDKNNNRCKIKSPAYTAFNRLHDSLSNSSANAVELVLLGKAEGVLEFLPEFLTKNLVLYLEQVPKLLAQTEADYQELKHIENAKEFALAAQQKIWPAALFALKRKKTPDLDTFVKSNHHDPTCLSRSMMIQVVQLCDKMFGAGNEK
jgi:hypothetical protein